ncbi:hypothetical protein ES703_57880 [subsurface metagenome]
MKNENDLGLMIVKPPFVENTEAVSRILNFIEDKFSQTFTDKSLQKIFDSFINDGGILAEKLYVGLQGKWDGLDNMLKYFKDKPMHLFIFYGEKGLAKFLKNITGATTYETGLSTIRGMMRKKYGIQKLEWLNFIHIPYTYELKRDLLILKNLQIIPKGLEEWQQYQTINDKLKTTLKEYDLL